MPDIGRNQPCPCGSGKKFKRCCLAKHAEGDDVSRAQRLHALDRRLISDIIEWSEHGEPALYTWALGMNAIEDEDDPVLDDIADSSLAVVTGPLDRTLATVFLEAKEGQLLDYESAWLRAVIDSWLGLWEVQSVTRGRGVRVRDLLTEQRREVLDVGLSESISRGSVVCARVVDFDGLTLFTCVHPRALDRLRTEQVIDAHLLEEDGPLPHPSDLYRGENANELLRFWDHNTRPTLPTLQNRDGDVLQETRDTLTFSPDDRSEIVDRMKGLTEFHEADDESMHFSFVRESDQTVLGTVNVRAQDMIIETTSEIRADDLLVHVLEAVRGLVEHADRERRDMQDFLASGMGRGPGPSDPPDVLTGPEADEMVLQYKTQAYATWPDTSLPMLEGATPRESMDDPALRRRIVAVLTDIANGEASLPPGQRYDVGILRTALGIGDDE